MKTNQQTKYSTNAGDVDVVIRHKWPSYEFLFCSIPKDHLLYKDEVCFFAWNDKRKDRDGAGFYVDIDELKILIDGFSRVLEQYKDSL